MHVEPWSRWALAAEEHNKCHSCQLRTTNWGYNSHKLNKIQHKFKQKIRKTLPGLMSLNISHSDGRVRICHKQYESMEPLCSPIFLANFEPLSTNSALFNPLRSKVYLGSLRCSDMPWHLCFFSVAYKHINGTGEITLYLAQTGLP